MQAAATKAALVVDKERRSARRRGAMMDDLGTRVRQEPVMSQR